MKSLLFIVNPVSGTSHNKKWVDKALKKLEGIYDIRTRETEYRGHGHVIATEEAEKGTDIVVAVGGDGTVNEIGGALIGTDTTLAIFPMGSGNGLARELGFSTKHADDSINRLHQGNTEMVDYGDADGKPFFCTCGTGFDAEIARLFTGNTKRGFWQYLKLCIKTFFSFKPIDTIIEVDGKKMEKKAFLLNIANIKQYGFGAQIAPLATVKDGLLDVTLVPPVNLLIALKLTFGMFTHRLHKMRPIETFKCTSLTLTLPKGAPFHIDGDYVEMQSETISVKVVPNGLKVIV